MPAGFNFKEAAKNLDRKSFVEIYNFAINIRNALTDQHPNGWGADDIADFLKSEMKFLEKDIVTNIKNIYEHFETFYGCNVGAIGLRLHIQAETILTTKNTSEATSSKRLYAQTMTPSISVEPSGFFKPYRKTELLGKDFKKFQFDMARKNAPKEKLIEVYDESLNDLVNLVETMHQKEDGMAYAVMCFGLFIQNIIEMCVADVDDRLDVGSAKALIENAKNSFVEISTMYKFKTQLSEILEKIVDNVINKLTGNIEFAQPSQPTQSYLSNTLQKPDEGVEKGERQTLLPKEADKNSSTCCTPCCVIM